MNIVMQPIRFVRWWRDHVTFEMHWPVARPIALYIFPAAIGWYVGNFGGLMLTLLLYGIAWLVAPFIPKH